MEECVVTQIGKEKNFKKIWEESEKKMKLERKDTATLKEIHKKGRVLLVTKCLSVHFRLS